MAAHRPIPSLVEESAALEAGYGLVAGVDEAGRGPWAGPVAAAAVILPVNQPERMARLDGVRDSKALSPRAREVLDIRIAEVAPGVGFGLASAEEIDRLGILPATRLAMQRAIAALPLHPNYLLIDAVKLPQVMIPQKSIVKGDALCVSIAAASIVAKVRRDRLMAELDELCPGYSFARHKGYGTSQHRQALQTLGVCPIHRRTFAPVRTSLTAETQRTQSLP